MKPKAELVSQEQNFFQLQGLLDVDSVAALQKAGFAALDAYKSANESEAASEFELDLSQVSVRGSAAIALLISWQRHARQQDVEIRFKHASENLLAIADASGVKEILNFS